jgi:hypothetical protein
MLEKLATHDIQDVPELFSLVDKCARATEGHAWHTTPVPEAGMESKPNARAATQGNSSNNNNNKKKKKKKVGGNNQPLAAAPTATAMVAGGAEDHKATSASTKSSVAMMVAPNAWFITLHAKA